MKNKEKTKKRWMSRILFYPHEYIKYDYCLPSPDLISDWVNEIINSMDISDSKKNKIKEKVDGREDRDDQSNIQGYMDIERLFGKEWFYGYGTLYRWRSGEKDNTLREFGYGYLSKNDEEIIEIIQSRLREKTKKYYAVK